MIIKQQPVASDLRESTSILKMITDLERISDQCADSIQEFSLYCWEENSGGDRVKKQDDHAMDDIRYFVSQMADQGEEFFVLSIPRGASRNKEVL